MDGRGPLNAADRDSRLVWKLFSPSARQLTCQMQAKDGGGYELVIADDQDHQIIRSGFAELSALHEKAAELRHALEGHGYATVGHGSRAPSRAGILGEPRAAFRGLIECSELLALDQRDVASALRDAATTGLVAIGLQDTQMTLDAIAMVRAALARARGRRADANALLDSCEALVARVEASLAPPS